MACPQALMVTHCSVSSCSGNQSNAKQRLVLSNKDRTKLNNGADSDFYSLPRLVTHVDDGFISELTQLYRERIPQQSEVLDLMSSWVSHLPPEKSYKRVVGHGMNAVELSKNNRLDYFIINDLNQEDPKLEFQDCSFDAVICAVSVQYLQQPEKVFAEIYRVLRPGGVCIVSFSNRLFYVKAIAAWRDAGAYARIQLVKQYFLCVDGFTQPEIIRNSSHKQGGSKGIGISWLMNLLQSNGKDPFYAVISYRNFKPIYD